MEDRASEGDEKTTYSGITVKTLFFLLMTGVGFATYYLIAPMLATGEPIVEEEYTFYIPQVILMLVAAVFTIVTPFLAWIIRVSIPVTGTLYAFSQGILISWISYTFAGQYNDVIILSVLITLVLVFSMFCFIPQVR